MCFKKPKEKTDCEQKDNGIIFEIIGLRFGDEGKATMVDYLNAEYIIRANGGAQAAHHVVVEDKHSGKEIFHCFSQFGSGTFNGAKTYLSDKMLIDPIRMVGEAKVLKEKGIENPFNLVTIDPQCLIITPFQAILNQMLEISRGDMRHGSCGIGFGQTVEDGRRLGAMALIAKDMFSKEILRKKLDFLWRIKIDIAEQLVESLPENQELLKRLNDLKSEGFVEDLVDYYHSFATTKGIKIERIEEEILNGKGNIIFEGAQGVLLDEVLGFHPYVTYSRTTFKNPDEKIKLSNTAKKVIKIGVMRAYDTRHGRGPFVTEDEWLGSLIPDKHNSTNDWQESFRIGYFDLLTTRYALECTGEVDCIALTNFDRLENFEKIKVCYAYELSGLQLEDLGEFFETKTEEGKTLISKIKFNPDPSTEHQIQLSQLLIRCKPVYVQIEKERYIEFLEKELGIDISIVSLGPKACDKIERKPLFEENRRVDNSAIIAENKIRSVIESEPLC